MVLFLLNIIQIIVSVLLIVAILFQQRGGGLSPVLGGDGAVYRTRRGVEKIIFWATVVLGVLFLAIAFTNIMLH